MPIWHGKQTIPPSSYVKALHEMKKGRRGEMTFVKMPVQNTTVPQIDQVVQAYDLEHHYNDEKKRKEASQPVRTPVKASMKPLFNFSAGHPNRK